MRLSINRAAAIGLLFTLALANSASAIEKKVPTEGTQGTTTGTAGTKGTTGTKAITGIKPTTAAPLTKAECEGLGGDVDTSVGGLICGSRGTCVTVDKDGVVRTACINE